MSVISEPSTVVMRSGTFLPFQQFFPSPRVKRNMIISNEYGI